MFLLHFGQSKYNLVRYQTQCKKINFFAIFIKQFKIFTRDIEMKNMLE